MLFTLLSYFNKYLGVKMRIIITLFFLVSFSLFSQNRLIWQNQGSPVYNINAILSQNEKVMAVTNSSSKPTTIWDVETGQLLDTIGDPMRISYDISLTGEHFVYLDNENVLHLRNVYTHSDDKTFSLPADIQINSLKILNNGQTPQIALLIYKDSNIDLAILDLEKQKITQQYPLEKEIYENYSYNIFVDTFGNYVAFSFADYTAKEDIDSIRNRIVLIDIKNEKLITKSVTVNRIHDIKLVPEKDKIIVATGSWQNDFENVIVIDFELNKTTEFEGSRRNIYKIDYVSNSSEDLFALSDDTLFTLNSELEIKKAQPFSSYQTMAFMAGNRYLQMLEYQVRIRDIDTKEIVNIYEEYQGNMHRMDVTDIEVSKDDKYIYSSSNDGTIKKWDAVSGQFIENYIETYNSIRKIGISEDGKYFAYTGYDDENNITLLNIDSKEVITKFTIPSSINDFELSKDSKFLVVGTYGGQVYIFDLDQNVLMDSLYGGHSVKGVGISPDNKYIASGSQEGIFKLWDFESRQPLFLEEITDKNGLYSIEFSTDNKEILISSGDGSLKLFDIKDLKVKEQYFKIGNTSSWSLFYDAIFSKDGKSIYGGTSEGIKSFKLGNSRAQTLVLINSNFKSYNFKCLKYFNNESVLVAGDNRGGITKWAGDTYTSVETVITRDNLVYPNPVINTLNINLPETKVANRFEITNILGEIVSAGLSENKIDITSLSSGTYVITLFSNSGIFRNKFVKQ